MLDCVDNFEKSVYNIGMNGGITMLVRFSVENYMSFKEPQVFSMAADKGTRHSTHVASAGSKRLLKGSFLFGANASGKSNFIHAIDFMRKAVCAGNTKVLKNRDKYFRIDSSCSNKPGIFQVDIVAENHLYSYGFALNYRSREFVAEWLYEIEDTKELCIFDRDVTTSEVQTDLDFKRHSKDGMRYEVYKSDVPADHLFLSDIAQREIESASLFQHFKRVYKWFLDVIVIYPDSHNIQITDYFTNNENNVTLSQMLSDFDTGIESLSSDKKAISEALAFIPKDIREKIINDIEEELQKKSDDSSAFMRGKKLTIAIENRRFNISIEDGELQAEELQMNHGNASDLFDILDESDGTQRLFDLIPAYQSLKEGKIIFIDEIDRSFHSKLTKEYIRRYFAITNGQSCQLICTTHDLNLMSLDLLRKDEIWFVERNEHHSSNLYSLSEFKTRCDKDVLKNYVQGRYGAIPCISESDYEGA